MAEQKEESKKEPTEEYAGLGKEVFVFKKEDFDNPSLWHKFSIVDDSTFSDFGNWIVGEEVSEEKPRSFIVPLTLVDEEEARYEAQMLARTVLPVFSKSMLSIPPASHAFPDAGLLYEVISQPYQFLLQGAVRTFTLSYSGSAVDSITV